MKFSIWDKFKRCKKLEINWHYLNPIPILRTSFPIPSCQIPVPVTPNPFSQLKNRPIPAPILPVHDPLLTDHNAKKDHEFYFRENWKEIGYSMFGELTYSSIATPS